MLKTIVLVVGWGVFTLATSVQAQEPIGGEIDPFGGGTDPFGTTVTPDETTIATPARAPQATPQDVETDPVVLAIRASNPTNPRDLMHAIENLMNLGRPDQAKQYLAKLIDAAPDAATMVELQREFGSALFLRMIRDERFAPEGGQLGAAVLEAAGAAARDPARLNALIHEVSNESSAARYAALVELNAGGSASAAALIHVLADSSRSAEHAAIRAALVSLKGISRDPLVGTLQARDPRLVAQAIVVLSKIDSGDAATYFLRPFFVSPPDSMLQRAAEIGLVRLLNQAPSRSEAERFLARRAEAYLDGQLTGRPDHEDMVRLWGWDETQQLPVEQRFPARVASLVSANRLASDLYQIAPDNADHRRLYLTTLMESAKLLHGLDQPLPTGTGTAHSLAAVLDQAVLADALEYALEREQGAAATGLIEVLGDVGDLRLLDSKQGLPSALARSLRHADPRVRFVAVEAIRKLDPREIYAGSSHLPEALGQLAGSAGVRRVLIAHPRLDQAQTLVGMFNELGFEGDVAQTGKAAMLLATRRQDYEFIILSDVIDDPPVNELLQQLRRNPLSARLPIGLMARQDDYAHMERLTADDPRAETFPRPHDVAGLSLVARRLLGLAGQDLMSHEERMHYAAVALDHLEKLAARADRYPFYDLLRQQGAVEQALTSQQLAPRAARVLGYFGSPLAQRALVAVASQNTRDLRERQAAAQAFDIAVQRRGLLLTQDEILLQYDRYNRSATLDRETQRVLGAVLDAIEAPTQTNAVGGSSASDGE